MSLDVDPTPHPKAETIILDQHQQQLAIIDGAFLWPPKQAVIELGEPNRDAVVKDVRLRLHPGHASVLIRVYDRGEIVPSASEGDEN